MILVAFVYGLLSCLLKRVYTIQDKLFFITAQKTTDKRSKKRKEKERKREPKAKDCGKHSFTKY